jgi:hypothetical protein
MTLAWPATALCCFAACAALAGCARVDGTVAARQAALGPSHHSGEEQACPGGVRQLEGLPGVDGYWAACGEIIRCAKPSSAGIIAGGIPNSSAPPLVVLPLLAVTLSIAVAVELGSSWQCRPAEGAEYERISNKLRDAGERLSHPRQAITNPRGSGFVTEADRGGRLLKNRSHERLVMLAARFDRAPSDEEAFGELLTAYEMERRLDVAKIAWDRFLAAHAEGGGQLQLGHARWLLEHGFADDALAEGLAIRARAEPQGLHALLGRALLALGRRDEAEVEFRQALAEDPDDSEARAALASPAP